MSEKHRAASLKNLERAMEANAARWVFGVWECAHCGKTAPATAHQRRQTYCSKECMSAAYAVRMKGEGNPNHRNASARVCEGCGAGFRSYNKERKYCSQACYHARPGTRSAPMKDANHEAVLAHFRARGCAVLDLSSIGRGVPDALVWCGDWVLVEIKNPQSWYGKAGLSATQRRWAEAWPAPVRVVTGIEDAEGLIADVSLGREFGEPRWAAVANAGEAIAAVEGWEAA